ncbi:MAG: hypothetical protein R8M45_07890, partial [Ghiorsea sp.]
SKGIKAAIAHIDRGIIKYLITMQYNENMLNHEDESIKGDAVVISKGSTALMMKEIQQMRRNDLLQTTINPVDMQIIGLEGRTKLLRETFKANDLDEIVPSDEDMQARLEQQRSIENDQTQQSNIEGDQQPTAQQQLPNDSGMV